MVELVALTPISYLTRQMDWLPQLHYLPFDQAHRLWWTFQIRTMMFI